MTQNLPTFNRHVVQPVECLKAGWALVKEHYWVFVGITAVGVLIGSIVPMGILMGPMMCGIYLVLLEHMRGRPIEFGMLFKGFDYFVESLIATLLQFVPVLVILVPFYALFGFGLAKFIEHQKQRGGPPAPAEIAGLFGGFGMFMAIAMIIGILVGVCFSFVYPLIVDRRLKAMQALEVSFKAGMANFWPLLGLLLLNGLLGVAGTCACYIGVFLVMPIVLGGLACAYRQVFGLASESPVASAGPPPVIPGA